MGSINVRAFLGDLTMAEMEKQLVAVHHERAWPVEVTLWRRAGQGLQAFYAVTSQENFIENRDAVEKGADPKYGSTNFISAKNVPLERELKSVVFSKYRELAQKDVQSKPKDGGAGQAEQAEAVN